MYKHAFRIIKSIICDGKLWCMVCDSLQRGSHLDGTSKQPQQRCHVSKCLGTASGDQWQPTDLHGPNFSSHGQNSFDLPSGSSTMVAKPTVRHLDVATAQPGPAVRPGSFQGPILAAEWNICKVTDMTNRNLSL